MVTRNQLSTLPCTFCVSRIVQDKGGAHDVVKIRFFRDATLERGKERLKVKLTTAREIDGGYFDFRNLQMEYIVGFNHDIYLSLSSGKGSGLLQSASHLSTPSGQIGANP